MHGAAWTQLELSPDRGKPLAAMQMAMRFLGAHPARQAEPAITSRVVYALGTIVDGKGEGVLGAREQIASHTLVAALRALTADDSVKAVVLRIDSGGGSAQASELIWRAVAELKAKKPVIVSMSDVAASGGYYIASGATKIFALDDTLTGSIGVVGGKLALRAALARLGVNTFPIGRGKRATMMASLGPWTEDERAAIRTSMEAVYRVFVGRVAAGRGKQVPRDREDRAGPGVDRRPRPRARPGRRDRRARRRARRGPQAGQGRRRHRPRDLPSGARRLRDLLASFGQVQAPLGLGSLSPGAGSDAGALLRALATIDPALAAATERLVQLVLSFRSSAVQAVAMLPVIQ